MGNENLDGMKIILDTCYGSATTCAESIFKKLGANTLVINNEKDGLKINLNCGSTCLNPLKKAIKENDNIFYSKLALKEQSEKKGKLVDIPRNIVDNFRKKAHFGYQQVINKRKDKFARETKTKDFLSELNKKK